MDVWLLLQMRTDDATFKSNNLDPTLCHISCHRIRRSAEEGTFCLWHSLWSVIVCRAQVSTQTNVKKKQCWHQQLILSQCVHCADAIHTYCLSKHPSALAQTRALFCLVMKRDFQFTFARDGSSRLLSNVRQTHINLSSPKVTETRYRDWTRLV